MSIPNNQFFDPQLFSADDLQILDAVQRRELMAAKALDSDLDIAYGIQLQEAIISSLSLYERPTATTSSFVTLSPPHDDDVSSFTDLQSDELLILDQEVEDRIFAEAEFRKMKDNYHRSIHDHRVASEIWRVSEEELKSWEDMLERPLGEGSSRGASVSDDEMFRVYFKGLVEKQLEEGVVIGGIGVAICDSRDKLLFELQKPLVGNGVCRRSTEIQALIEGLNAALQLELKRVVFYCDFVPIFKIVSGHWSPKQKKISSLVNQVSCLREKFTYCQPSLVPRHAIKFAFKLAREAIVSHASKEAESSGSETCVICLEDTNISEIFSIDKCMHRYCFACMKQHVEVKLLHGLLPTCPHDDCKTELKTDSCSQFLTPRLIEMMSQRMMEASIPVTEKVYCPYPKCSALMSRKDVLEYSKGAFVGAERSGARKCIKCNSRFCIDCKVPWHNNMTCFDYKLSNPCPPLEEAKLKNLAATNLWRQCVKCNHMIELATGCYHMTCRCGYEFCYACGAEWKKKKATCTCPLWDEQNILEDELDEDEEEDEDEDEDDEEDEGEDEEAYYDDYNWL